MVSVDREVVPPGYLSKHCLHRVVADFPLAAAAPADQMVVWREPRDFIIGLAITGVCRNDDPQVNEEPDRAVDRRAVDCGVRLAHPRVDLAERRVAVPRTNCFE